MTISSFQDVVFCTFLILFGRGLGRDMVFFLTKKTNIFEYFQLQRFINEMENHSQHFAPQSETFGCDVSCRITLCKVDMFNGKGMFFEPLLYAEYFIFVHHG